MRIPNQDNRREIYMLMALIVAILGFSHGMGYWLYGIQHGLPSQSSIDTGPMIQKSLWPFFYWLSMMVVAVLFVVGRVTGRRQPPPPKPYTESGQKIADGAPKVSAPEVFKVQSIKADPQATGKDIVFKNKIRMNLTNITGRDIYVWIPLWESSLVQTQVDPPGSRFRLERSKGGWQKNEWAQEEDTNKPGVFRNRAYCCLKVKPDVTFDCYVGLAPPSDQNVDGLLKRYGTIGTVLLPVKIDGTLHEVRISAVEV